MRILISAFQRFSISVFTFISLCCAGCISSTVRKPDGSLVHFASVAQNIQRLEYKADGSFRAGGVDSTGPVTGLVKTAGLISIGKMATRGVTGVASEAVSKIGE